MTAHQHQDQRDRASATALGAFVAYLVAVAVTYGVLGDRTLLTRLLNPRFFLATAIVMPFAAAISRIVQLRRTDVWRWRKAAVVGLLTPLFFNTFVAAKVLIPRIHPFAWDTRLAHADTWLHGAAPDTYLRWIPLSWMDVAYDLWFLLLVVSVSALAWRRNARPLLALEIVWIAGGTFGAIAMSSAGPCYYALVTGTPGPYQALLTHLHSKPLLATAVQAALWNTYRDGRVAAGTGISAFPSMHVATVAVLTFSAWEYSRKLGALVGTCTAIILVSSVGLGWHYALDGYAAIVLAAIGWWSSGRGTSRSTRPLKTAD